jgi:hypothetical protein
MAWTVFMQGKERRPGLGEREKYLDFHFILEDGDTMFLRNDGTYESTWRHNPEQHRLLHRLEILKSYEFVVIA